MLYNGATYQRVEIAIPEQSEELLRAYFPVKPPLGRLGNRTLVYTAHDEKVGVASPALISDVTLVCIQGEL